MATLLILGEDVAHGALAGELVRATLLTYAEAHLADWFSESVDALLTWRGDEELSVVRSGLRYAKSAGAGRELKLRGTWPEGGTPPPDPSGPGVQSWRRKLTWARLQEGVEGIVVVTDTDGDSTNALEQVAAHLPDPDQPDTPRPIVLAIAHQDAEGWFALGFAPRDAHEETRHAAKTRELSFDPADLPHRLTASPNNAPTDAKRVLGHLLWGTNSSEAVGREQIVEVLERGPHRQSRGAVRNPGVC